ncbi:MAG: aminodeoxychorismate synthase component I [Bacteroidetes bacterium]|nr:aminodeoxychorismate synthase component I [Bacteroidota bacterium]
MNLTEFESKLNQLGLKRVPFFFLIDFEMENPMAWEMREVPKEILFSVSGFTNTKAEVKKQKVQLKKYPISYHEYKSKFDIVENRISFGDSYLTNLTIKTKIEIDHSLEELFFQTSAKYKVLWKNKFLVFSPETFIRMESGKIFSFPMKGTIDASIPDAEKLILKDQKELSEHITIVDLIRNDLSRVASDVSVKRFRYIEKIRTNQKDLLQVSSEIRGKLPDDFHSIIGSIVISMLPAGSVSGAPKNKTLQIIREAEKEKRSYYTGVVGYYDGNNLDSGVMIRFIEQDKDQFYYRSGGGITSQSKAESEYQETIDKIYVPVY